MKKNLLSLFSGCGGMDLGFEGNFEVFKPCINEKIHPDWINGRSNGKVTLPETCFQTVFANDILNSCRATWVPFFEERGIEPEKFHLESIVNLVKACWEKDFSFPLNIDVVTGGFPCQDFSVAGKRKGFKSHKSHLGELLSSNDNPSIENRGTLYMWMKEVIEITKPKIFIAENVKGLVSLSNVKEIIEKDFKSIDKEGYLVIPAQVLMAADYGVPQSRERVLFIGLNKKFLTKEALKALTLKKIPQEFDPYPIKTHIKSHVNEEQMSFFDTLQENDNLKSYVTTKEVLKNLKEPEEESKDLAQMSYSKAKYYGKMQGNTEISLNEIGPTIRSEHHGNIEFRRLSKGNGGKILEELEAGLPERRLTVRECARLQTFPDNYVFVRQGKKNDPYNISASSAYKVIGNAVPPLLAYHLAKRLESLWEHLFIE